MNQKITSYSVEQTIQLGKQYSAALKQGGILGLVGDLGTGKTHFTKGIALGLGVQKEITSPTFVLVKPYQAKRRGKQHITLVHLDCYRLSSSEELQELGFDELIANKNNLVVIEWALKIKNILPPHTQWVEFKAISTSNTRQIIFI